MKLVYSIIWRLSAALLVIMAAWASVFYYIIVDEINDETDDSLEDYSAYIIKRALAGEELPSKDNGTNNSYHIREVSAEYADHTPRVQYLDQEVYIYSKRETEPARVRTAIFRDDDDRYWELTVSIPTFEKSDLLETILWWLVVLYILLTLVILAVNAWIIHRSFRPLYTLLRWLDGLTLGGVIPPLENETRVTEFRRLNDAMVRHAHRNNEMYEQQRLFIGNASHEMQTPVAVCRNRLEILANDPSLGEQQLAEVLKTTQTLDHISKLNKTLLLLTKIDNRQFASNGEVDVAALLRKLAADYSEVYELRGIRVDFRQEASPLVAMNDTLANMLFSNLIKNAFVHNRDTGGRIEIAVTPGGVSISNTSDEGVLDSGRIFTRFYQGSKKRGSLGLGLALVESICKTCGMQVSYGYRNGWHCFVVAFPAQRAK